MADAKKDTANLSYANTNRHVHTHTKLCKQTKKIDNLTEHFYHTNRFVHAKKKIRHKKKL